MLRISSTPSPMLPLMASDVGTHILNQTASTRQKLADLGIDSLPDGVQLLIICTARIRPI